MSSSVCSCSCLGSSQVKSCRSSTVAADPLLNKLLILWLWRPNPIHDDQRRFWLSVSPWSVTGWPWVCVGQMCGQPYDGSWVGFQLTSLFWHLTAKEEFIGIFKIFTCREREVHLWSFAPFCFSSLFEPTGPAWTLGLVVDNTSAAGTGRLSQLLKLKLALSLLFYFSHIRVHLEPRISWWSILGGKINQGNLVIKIAEERACRVWKGQC